jgi:hypothetical protein
MGDFAVSEVGEVVHHECGAGVIIVCHGVVVG